jgi:hypothetical protein
VLADRAAAVLEQTTTRLQRLVALIRAAVVVAADSMEQTLVLAALAVRAL